MQFALGLLGVATMMFSLLVLSGDVELNPGPGNGGGEDGAGLAESKLHHLSM